MAEVLQIIIDSYAGYWSFLVEEVLHPSWHNYFYWLIVLSILCWALEIVFPWRKGQSIVRKDFWLDAFYMFFNFFLFSLIAYNAISNVVVEFFNRGLQSIGVTNLVALEVGSLPGWVQLLIMFFVRDFIQWNIHRLLHRSSFLWEFHKVHHSVEEMGFAAHLRYHWMENVVYRTLEYVPLAMIGFGIEDFFVIHIFSLAIGHLNHSNIKLPLGRLRYIFNSPQMHIWHHARNIPKPYGVNFGLSLSLWDYIFKTSYQPRDGGLEPLGFDGMETYPKKFIEQSLHLR